MLIALDHDGTYDLDPSLWDAFIRKASQRGHKVICVSMRGPTAKIEMPCDVIYTSGRAKRAYCEGLALQVTVWIDDQPFRIENDARSSL